MVSIHEHLRRVGLDHAFGGALALAWCTQRARGTIDLDLNVFVAPTRTGEVLDALPGQVTAADEHRRALEHTGQARLWWDTTPVDVFLNTSEYHDEVATRVRWEPFAGTELPFLGCDDLAVFKAFFDRTKDWADLEAMHEAGSLDVARVAGVLTSLLGGDDERIAHLLRI
jgi:hypothetical protein